MKLNKKLSIITFLLAVITSCQDNEKSNLTLLSDQIPTDTALVFGQGIISTDNFEFAITFSPEMDEMYFTRRKPDEDNEIYSMQLADGKWSIPESAFFKADKGWDFEPHIDPEGKLLYFGSTRPLNDTIKASGLHQWYCKKNVSGWGKPKPLEKPFADRSVVMYLTSSVNGNLYFTTGEKGDKPEDWVIYNSINEKGTYKSINRMGNEINFSGKYIAHPYISPDESYIIYDGESSSGYGNNDLYISFNKKGTWTKAINLGPEVNTKQTEMCPSVSPDGKYLFFHRGGEDSGDIYWIDFRPIKERIANIISNEQGA
jgi:Tol biopolymer transport system component